MRTSVCVLVKTEDWLTFTYKSALYRVGFGATEPICSKYIRKGNEWVRIPETSEPMVALAYWLLNNYV